MARYATEGEAAFEPRSRRPHTSPEATGATTAELVLRLRKQLTGAGLDAGADTIGWHLTHHHHRITARIVVATFTDAAAQHGCPVATLTDNSTVCATRFAGGRGGRNHLEHELRRRNVAQKNSHPDHPTTCGKVDRFQQTLEKWLRAQPVQPATTAQLQTLIDVFVPAYNHDRPHRSLPHRATPATAYAARPKATPASIRCSGNRFCATVLPVAIPRGSARRH